MDEAVAEIEVEDVVAVVFHPAPRVAVLFAQDRVEVLDSVEKRGSSEAVMKGAVVLVREEVVEKVAEEFADEVWMWVVVLGEMVLMLQPDGRVQVLERAVVESFLVVLLPVGWRVAELSSAGVVSMWRVAGFGADLPEEVVWYVRLGWKDDGTSVESVPGKPVPVPKAVVPKLPVVTVTLAVTTADDVTVRVRTLVESSSVSEVRVELLQKPDDVNPGSTDSVMVPAVPVSVGRLVCEVWFHPGDVVMVPGAVSQLEMAVP